MSEPGRPDVMEAWRLFPYALLLVACGLADWALTVDALQGGFATEGNPIAGLMLAQGVVVSLLWKTAATVGAALILIAAAGRYHWARHALAFCACIYFVLLIWHVIGRVIVFG